ncbi:hypothetical protein CFC21_041638 [Triticum aestivum]|uniref:3'-5' exonuclease domain-containing protein n=3 Tax=Triticum TaxID=4564 RepID=A0A077RS50_WHEAT|nr:Werner Syndrome-like exonuclease [Triticum dicoccoides]XP_044344698.1 Werner Syndrome-like exonuclease [Triticum aestivum]VAH78040.1 unnamed protein product [Triticum turgidum subsp. durum]KAF7030017.1 hypothetical protein CFC21_041638 [Triticum aestivum]CDM82743.1 unnamed protein product [Triticum aestivum]CDM83569.1 unnamed protein product [Triticum aestivum]
MAITYHAPPQPTEQPVAPRHRSRVDADVVMDDGTVIRTTVTSSACDVLLFLRELQELFCKEIHDHNSLSKVQEQQGLEEVQQHLHCLVVGLDTEWHQISETGGKPRYQIAVLQLCVGDRCLVYQIFHADYIPAELAAFLANPDFCFVAVGAGGDVKRLHDDCNLEVAHTMDLPQVAAVVLGRPELRQAGLKTLAREVMDTLIEKPKKVTMSKWAAPHLSWEQVRYACIDAFVSFDVGRRLLCEPRV